MSILFATPMYGGQCLEPFFTSCLGLQRDLILSGIDHDFLTGRNESLVQRARNNIVAAFLETHYEYLMFIDADIEFHQQDVANLWNLQADVCCGAYPLKQIDSVCSAWVDGHQVDIAALSEPTVVDFAGTGFMMIRRSVIEKMIEKYPETMYGEGGVKHALFDCGVTPCDQLYQNIKGAFDNDLPVYLSEDYTFCQRWREMGGSILLDPSIMLKHWGLYGFAGRVKH